MNSKDQKFMAEACAEAAKGIGLTSPNPAVGAIAVKDGKIISRGWHRKAGCGHAEVDCLKDELDFSGASLYVTLEPCSTHGRTPPCTQKIIDAGIKEVIIGNLDPNPVHAGRAVKILEDAGISVRHGVLKEKCWSLNLPFFKWIQKGTPFVHLKMAMTLDGKIATEKGQSKWITGTQAREEVQNMRRHCDAIMVGGETIRRDNSSLRVTGSDWEQPWRFVWSSRDDWDFNLKCFLNDDGKKASVCKPQTNSEWQSFLKEAAKKDITNLLLEGGGELAANALQCGIVDKVSFFIAPKILGGKNSRSAVSGKNPQSLNDALPLQNVSWKAVGDDLLYEGFLSQIWQCQ